MDDLKAIRLFVEDGGLAHEWHCVDQSVRNYWLKKAEPAAIPSGLAAGPINADPFASSDGLDAKIHHNPSAVGACRKRQARKTYT